MIVWGAIFIPTSADWAGAKKETKEMANANLTAETIEEVLKFKPELRAEMRNAVKAEIDRLNAIYAALGGKGSSGRSSKSQEVGEVTDGKTHGEAITHALGLAKFKEGATSRELREFLATKGHPISSASLGTTLQNLQKEKVVKKSGDRGSMVYYLP